MGGDVHLAAVTEKRTMETVTNSVLNWDNVSVSHFEIKIAIIIIQC